MGGSAGSGCGSGNDGIGSGIGAIGISGGVGSVESLPEPGFPKHLPIFNESQYVHGQQAISLIGKMNLYLSFFTLVSFHTLSEL